MHALGRTAIFATPRHNWRPIESPPQYDIAVMFRGFSGVAVNWAFMTARGSCLPRQLRDWSLVEFPRGFFEHASIVTSVVEFLYKHAGIPINFYMHAENSIFNHVKLNQIRIVTKIFGLNRHLELFGTGRTRLTRF